eukprot:349653-Chlamydomonas_euryale.AAC.6
MASEREGSRGATLWGRQRPTSATGYKAAELYAQVLQQACTWCMCAAEMCYPDTDMHPRYILVNACCLP